jgi:hypothetical protein
MHFKMRFQRLIWNAFLGFQILVMRRIVISFKESKTQIAVSSKQTSPKQTVAGSGTNTEIIVSM